MALSIYFTDPRMCIIRVQAIQLAIKKDVLGSIQGSKYVPSNGFLYTDQRRERSIKNLIIIKRAKQGS
jgi:hypothetical protein